MRRIIGTIGATLAMAAFVTTSAAPAGAQSTNDAGSSSLSTVNWVPLQDPAGSPYFGKLDPNAP